MILKQAKTEQIYIKIKITCCIQNCKTNLSIFAYIYILFILIFLFNVRLSIIIFLSHILYFIQR